MSYLKFKSHYNKFPRVQIKSSTDELFKGNDAIFGEWNKTPFDLLVIECYPGVDYERLKLDLLQKFDAEIIHVDDYALSEKAKLDRVRYHLTDDRVFGRMSQFVIEDFYEKDQVQRLKERVQQANKPVIVFGFGASAFFDGSINVYMDMARWEIKTRFRSKTLTNWRMTDYDQDGLRKEKHGYFIDWRVADRLKQKQLKFMDYYIDANDSTNLKMVFASAIFEAIEQTVNQPFSMVPYFDKGVWGGQWMKEICNLNEDEVNYAWCFNGVMEEQSMYFAFGDDVIESPAINLVLFKPVELLGERVYARFGKEFPIRFDFLDTMEGQNLSLQVHPLTEYIQDTFGMHYTQDESYYIMDANRGGVYLGLKDNIDREAMVEDLKRAEKGETVFAADKYVNYYDVKVHDHISIPAGTIHCSAKNSMVLEISATPYIFTFKMWDWERLGLDGLPRPIHLDHALKNVQWDRTTTWVEKELMNPVEVVRETEGVLEERTGLHAREFLETRRHTHNKKVDHYSPGSLSVVVLVDGAQAIIESPEGLFKPFVLNYAEVVVMPEKIRHFTISPYGDSAGKMIKTIKAYVRG